jgi:undecaprenyl-diphosphatase
VSGPAARLLDHPAIERFDERFDRWLDSLRGTPAIDSLFTAASHLGDFALLWHLVGGLRGLRSERQATEALQLSALLGLESLLVNQGIKRLFRRARPTPSGDERYGLRTPSTSSFPSGHASAAFFSAAYLTRRSPGLAPVWYGVAIVVAVSRPYTRIHHASDIIGGALVGAALARIAESGLTVGRLRSRDR